MIEHEEKEVVIKKLSKFSITQEGDDKPTNLVMTPRENGGVFLAIEAWVGAYDRWQTAPIWMSRIETEALRDALTRLLNDS